MTVTEHASLVALHQPDGWHGVLIQGPSGSGKSDLVLRALDIGFRLVADDRTLVWASGGHLYGRAPEALAGRLEARGLGILTLPALRYCRIRLWVSTGQPDRLGPPAWITCQGVRVPTLLAPFLEASCATKLQHALWSLGAGAEGAYQGDLAAQIPPRSGGDSR